MRKFIVALGAVSLAIPVAMTAPAAIAAPAAKSYTPAAAYDAQRRNHRNQRAQQWRGRDGRTYCRRSDGTTGLLVGAVGGALVGRTIDTRGDRTGGTVIGAVAGALAGREIDRGSDRSRQRCR